MRVLFVCTANICRSPSAQWLMRDTLARSPELGRVEVHSAGTHALAGAQGCRVAVPLADHWAEHRATQLTSELTGWADLILPMSREHRAAISALDPSTRSRTFTLRQAGRIADWLLASGAPLAAGDVVAQLDAGRGHLPAEEPAAQVGSARRWGFSGRRRPGVAEPVHADEVPDPHVLGTQLHPVAADRIRDGVDALVALLRAAQRPAGGPV